MGALCEDFLQGKGLHMVETKDHPLGSRLLLAVFKQVLMVLVEHKLETY